MTKKRKDLKDLHCPNCGVLVKKNYTASTEFGLWLRDQKELDSLDFGFTATNIDYVWRNFKMNKFMLIEEKRYDKLPKRDQKDIFSLLDYICRKNKSYCGFYLLIFEKTNPEDGKMTLYKKKEFDKNYEKKIISKHDLLDFLKFEKSFEDINSNSL